MTNILLVAGIVILIVVLRRTRNRVRPYRGLFTPVDRAVRRETDKVLGALHASVPDWWQAPGHWLRAEASDEHTGLLCGIATRPGPARLRIKEAVNERVRTADMRLEDIMRECLAERPCRVAVERASDKKIVLLNSWEATRYEKHSNPAEPDYYGYHADRAADLLTDREPDGLWQTAYDATVSLNLGDNDAYVVVKTVAIDMEEMKGVRKDFEDVHRMTYGGNPPPPHSDDRETPVEVSVAEAELAHNLIVEQVLRLVARKSRRRLDAFVWHMRRLRRAMLRAFPEYAAVLETAAPEIAASRARSLGTALHRIPNRVLKEIAASMTDMERNFVAAGVFACIAARVDELHDTNSALDWSIQRQSGSDGREPNHPAPAYARTLGNRSFRRKMETVLGKNITMNVIAAYDDAISTRQLRARVAAACRQHGAALSESAEDMAAVVESQSEFTSAGSPLRPRYGGMDRHERFRQAVDDAVANVLCQEIGPQT